MGKNKDELAKNVYTKVVKKLRMSQKSSIFALGKGKNSSTQP